MIDSDPADLQLEKKTEGVILCRRPGPAPHTLTLDGCAYDRFHDFIYVSRKLEDLSPAQVMAVCELREQFSTEEQLARNRFIRHLFTKLVHTFCPGTLLEIGPGAHPIFPPNGTSFRYELAELNSRNVQRLAALGYSARRFDSETPLDHIPCKSVEMIVALFVFHFPIAALQASEVQRILSNSGVLVANIYRRSGDARHQLKDLLCSQGLQLEVVERSDGVGYNHEYWILGWNLSLPRCSQVLELLRSTD